jgi:tripartite ATP-independent transporter DctP family solute receptor
MKKIISVLAAAGMAISLLAGCGGSAPAAQPEAAADTGSANAELTLIIASNATDPTNPYSYGLDKFKEVAEEVSGGKIAVTVHKGTLGENESELVEKLTMGAADMVVSSPGFMTAIGVPEIDIFSLEYLFDSFDHWEASVDGDFGSAMKDIVQEKTGNQFKIMGYWSSSVRDVYAKQAVTGPQDLKGLSIRTQSAVVQQDFFKNCGAIPTTVAWGELYQALQQGVVDGAENDYTNLTLKEHHKTPNGKYISETHHDYTTRLFLMDGSKYDRLTDEQKEWIDTASKAAQEEEREITYRMFEESKQKAIEEGAVVTEHADIDIDAFKAIAIPIQDSFAEANGMTEQLEMIRNTAK